MVYVVKSYNKNTGDKLQMTDKSISQQNNTPPNSEAKPPQIQEMGFPLIQEIEKLDSLVFNSFRVPFIGKVLVDENSLLDQLDSIKMNIPDCLDQAIEILQQREKILMEAQQYAQKIVENAQRKATQMLNENTIRQQAESQAYQIKRQLQQDCENLQQKTIAEVEQIRQKIQQDAIRIRQQAIQEAEEIQNEADVYADKMLARLEKDLSDMLRVVSNGRQQVYRQQVTPPIQRSPINPMNQKAS